MELSYDDSKRLIDAPRPSLKSYGFCFLAPRVEINEIMWSTGISMMGKKEWTTHAPDRNNVICRRIYLGQCFGRKVF